MKFIADFFPVLLFFVMYFFAGRDVQGAQEFAQQWLAWLVQGGVIPATQAPILLATALAVFAMSLQIVTLLVLRKKVSAMQWLTFLVFLIFGGATIYFHNETFIKWKPTVLYWTLACVLLCAKLIWRRDLLRNLMEPGGLDLPDSVWQQLNYAWMIFFVAVGLLNLYIAFTFSLSVWVSFKVFGLLAITLVFAVLQGLLLIRHVRDQSES